MTVTAERAITFTCEECGYNQYGDYTLERDWENDRAVNADNIDCEQCGHTNRVIEEL